MPQLRNNLKIILISLAIADLLGAIDSMSLNVALPQITKDLAIPIHVAQWIPNAYTLALVSTLILMGKIGDKIGAKRLYLIGLAIFGLTSLLLGFINSVPLLIMIRAVQGVSTAVLYTMPMAIIARLWKDREKAFAVTASFFAAGMLIGPVLGGILAGVHISNYFGWHLIFLINLPLVIAGLWITNKFVPIIPPHPKAKIEYLSVVILFLSLMVITLSLSQIINSLWLFAGVIGLVILYLYQTWVSNHLFDFSLFRNRTFSAANGVSFIAMVALIGMSFVLTFYFQDTLGWSPTKAGFALLPVPVITGIFAGFGGQIKNWRTGAILCASLIFLGLLFLSRMGSDHPYWRGALPGLALVAAGGGFLMTSIFAAILGSSPTDKSGSASGILNTIQQLGSLIGIALVASSVIDYKRAFIMLTLISIVGIVIAFTVRDNREIYQIQGEK